MLILQLCFLHSVLLLVMMVDGSCFLQSNQQRRHEVQKRYKTRRKCCTQFSYCVKGSQAKIYIWDNVQMVQHIHTYKILMTQTSVTSLSVCLSVCLLIPDTCCIPKVFAKVLLLFACVCVFGACCTWYFYEILVDFFKSCFPFITLPRLCHQLVVLRFLRFSFSLLTLVSWHPSWQQPKHAWLNFTCFLLLLLLCFSFYATYFPCSVPPSSVLFCLFYY